MPKSRKLFYRYQRRPRWVLWLAALAVALLLGVSYLAFSFGAIATGFFAKSLCSAAFVALRAPLEVVENDIRVHSPRALFAAIEWSLDPEKKTVSTRLPLGLGKGYARFEAGQGCALVRHEASDAKLIHPHINAAAMSLPRPAELDANLAWPLGEMVDVTDLPDVTQRKLAQALDRGFAQGNSQAPRRTRAIVVVHRGRIVAERYAPGFDAQTRMAGWSMAKSATAAWVGALVQNRVISVDDPLGLAQWGSVADSRAKISFRQALQMVSGLDFSERYGSPFSDVNRMLFFSDDVAAYAAARPPKAAPGAQFAYTSGTTNLISRALRERLGAAYAHSPYEQLLHRIGMTSAVFEADASGTWVGSSYLYASARDWARLGLLYLRDGVWNGQRVLPDGWVKFSRTATPASAEYGAHWWLQEPSAPGDPRVPNELFQATGFAGQRISVLPSQDLVIVRLGLTLDSKALQHAELITDIIAALQ